MRAPLLASLTDFGLADPSVGVRKAVVLARCPELPIFELTHEVPPQEVGGADPSEVGARSARTGRIAVVDRYGNLISDLVAQDDGWEARDAVLELAGRWTLRPVRTYADVASGELLAYVGSYGT